MIHEVKLAYRRADGAFVAALSVIILGIAPLISVNLFAEKLSLVFGPMTSAEQAIEAPAELAGAKLSLESECLAEAMYYEARGEGVQGQKAVAEVVLQRTRNRNFANTVCGVVHEGALSGKRGGCQFSYWCDGKAESPKEPAVWQQTKLLAEKIMTGQVRLAGQTGHAIAYHSVDVQPFWSATMLKTATIGNHVFYRFAPRNVETSEDSAQQPQSAKGAQPNVQNISATDDGV